MLVCCFFGCRKIRLGNADLYGEKDGEIEEREKEAIDRNKIVRIDKLLK